MFSIKRFTLSLLLAFLLSACANQGRSPYQAQSNTAKATIHARLAKGYLGKKQYAVTNDELRIALSNDPNHSESHYIMALLMLELQQFDSADEHFQLAIENNKNNASAAHDYATFLCQRGESEKAIDYFELAINNPLFEHPELSYMRVGECLADVDTDRAEQYLLKALSINAKLAPALMQMAQISYTKSDYLPARAYIERYFAIYKPQAAALLLAYKIESQLESARLAKQYRQQLLQLFPESQQAVELSNSQ